MSVADLFCVSAPLHGAEMQKKACKKKYTTEICLCVSDFGEVWK
jgi:hypothetical protein